MHRLLTTGHREVVDADLSDYFGQIPPRGVDEVHRASRERRAAADLAEDGLDGGAPHEWPRVGVMVGQVVFDGRDQLGWRPA